MKKSSAFIAAAAVATTSAGASGVGAVDVAAEPDGQCVVHVIGIERDGRYLTTQPVCYPTIAESLAAAGVPVDASRGDLSFDEIQRSGAIALADRTIGVHWDGANRTGA